MVAPPGEQTLSFNCPGCCSDSNSILAAPCGKEEKTAARTDRETHHQILLFSTVESSMQHSQGQAAKTLFRAEKACR